MNIIPFISVGNLKFSDNRKSIREKVNEKYSSGVKEFAEIKDYYDFFPDSDMFVYYDDKDNVTAFEFFKPKPTYNGLDLLMLSYIKLRNEFLNFDKDLQIEFTGFRSINLGIGVHAPSAYENPEVKPESVIIFKKNYYEF
jgi:hypothetical protein